MAKKATNKKESLPMEEMLWKACDALRGSIEPSEYKHVVLSLIFLKYAGFHFEKRRQEIIADGLEDFVDSVEFYAAKNVFYLPETSRWEIWLIIRDVRRTPNSQILRQRLIRHYRTLKKRTSLCRARFQITIIARSV